MQSAYAGFFLPINKVSSSQNSIVKTAKSSDDSFMNMLSERISSSKRANNGPSLGKTELSSKSPNAINEGKSNPLTDVSDKNSVLEASGQVKSVHVSQKTDTGISETSQVDVSAQDGEKTENTDNADYIESMIALLEDFLALFNGNVIKEGYKEGYLGDLDARQAVENISPDVMKALASSLENLKAMSADMSLIPETVQQDITSFLDEISRIIGQNYGIDGNTGLIIEVQKENESMDAVINRLKSQCSELIEKLKIGMPKSEELVSTAETAISEAGFVESETMEFSNTDISGENTAKAVKKPDSENGKADLDKHDAVLNKSDIQVQDALPDDTAVLINVRNPIKAMDEVVEKVPVSALEKLVPEDVTEQVVMKVKLMAGENKQEMEMRLEPESLGKLTLKIVHERGEVLAKITAENEQVKSILEGSMQLLKDALEKSGVSVQSLSVSVGNKGEREAGNEPDKTQNRKAGTVGSGTSVEAAPALKSSGIVYTGYYGDFYDNGTQINLTA